MDMRINLYKPPQGREQTCAFSKSSIRDHDFFLIATVNVNTAHLCYRCQCKSAIIIDGASGRVLYAKDEHQKGGSRASQNYDRRPRHRIRQNGSNGDGFGKCCQNRRLRHLFNRRSKVKLKDLVYGLMLRSGNDAAVAIAEHVGGSLDGFVYMMNQKAEQILV